MGGFLIPIGTFLIFLELCIITFVWKTVRNAIVRVGAIVLSVLIPCYVILEGYSSLARTNQGTNIFFLTIGWILFYILLMVPLMCTGWWVYSRFAKPAHTISCRKCGLENPAGTWLCKACRSIWPEYPIGLLVAALVLLFVGIRVIGQILSVVFFRG